MVTATDGETALQLARARPFDVVVLDVMMPGMSGMDVCRILRAESAVPIVLLTTTGVLGVRDYVAKHGFPGVALGLSGGIDSALTLAIAVDALGKDKVHAVMMPSPYTSQMSLDDARGQAELSGVKYSVLPIGDMMKAAEATLASEAVLYGSATAAD